MRKELEILLLEYKEELLSEPFNDYGSHIVDCVDLIIADLQIRY